MSCTIGLAAAFPGRRILPVPLPAHTREQEKKNRKYWCSSGGGLHCAREIVKAKRIDVKTNVLGRSVRAYAVHYS
jgi:hypothetical protein